MSRNKQMTSEKSPWRCKFFYVTLSHDVTTVRNHCHKSNTPQVASTLEAPLKQAYECHGEKLAPSSGL